MHRFILAAASIAALSATPVFAADLSLPSLTQSSPVSYSSAAYDWSGFYAGVNAGYGWGQYENTNIDFQVNDDDVNIVDLQGWLGGVQAGYNYDMGGFVLGAEADAQYAAIGFTEANEFGEATATLNGFGTLRARAGFAVDRFMPYVTAGVAVGIATIDNQFVDEDLSLEFHETQMHVGWTAGVGAEYAVADSITLKAEALYTDFGKATYFGDDASNELALRATTVRLGANFKF